MQVLLRELSEAQKSYSAEVRRLYVQLQQERTETRRYLEVIERARLEARVALERLEEDQPVLAEWVVRDLIRVLGYAA